jgi:uncharacterized protein YacL
MNLLHLSSAVVWVDFIVIILSKVFHLGKSLDKWYAQFGIVAVLSDCLIILLGILIAQFLVPKASLEFLIFVAVCVQLIHDYLFYIFVIKPLPKGQNSMIDLFKEYAEENSWKILVADSLMISATIFGASYLETISSSATSFTGLLGLYALTYIIYTK